MNWSGTHTMTVICGSGPGVEYDCQCWTAIAHGLIGYYFAIPATVLLMG